MKVFQSRSFEGKIHKFKIKTTQYLLAYRFADENLELIMIGPHQNYYRDLKKYIKST